MDNAKHTEGLWCLHPNNKVDIISSRDGFLIAHVGKDAREQGEYEANAEFIVKACNSHEELMTVAKGCLGYLQYLPDAYRPDPAWFKPLLTAIAKAEGGRK